MTGLEDHALLKPWLLPAEHVLWSGRPPRGLRLSAQDAFLIPFSLVWGGFALFWNVGVWAVDAPLLFRLFGLPFLAVGLYLVVGRFFHDAWRRGRILYAVTNRRILFLRTGRAAGIVSHDLSALPALSFTERRDGSGTIAFDPEPVQAFAGRTRAWPASPSRAFEGIERVRTVYDLIRRESDRARLAPA